MGTLKEIEKTINRVKEYNQDAGHELHVQLHHAMNSARVITTKDLTWLLKSDLDVADKYYSIDDKEHAEIRNIQDSIISFFGD